MQDRNGLKRGTTVTIQKPWDIYGKATVLGFWSKELEPDALNQISHIGGTNDGAALVATKNGQMLVNCDLLVKEGSEVDEIGERGLILADGTYLEYGRLARILIELDLSTISAIRGFRKQPAFVREHIAGTLKESGRLLLGAYPTPDWLTWGD